MTHLSARRKSLCQTSLLCCALLGPTGQQAMAQTVLPTATTLPSDSLYRLSIALTDAQGHRFDWHDQIGRAQLVTMFYGDCRTACPLVLQTLQQTVTAAHLLPQQLGVTMVSLDPLHDTPSSLTALAQSHHLDPAVFRLAVAADDSHTRMLAAVLNIQYRSRANGEISHTTRVLLLDTNGRVVASSTALGATPDPEFLKQIQSITKS